MTPDQMAEIHASAFAPARGWSAQEFRTLCASPHVQEFTADRGFVLIRAIAGEAEILTLAVAPVAHRKGIADALMKRWMRAVPAQVGFLEVAADNHPARALYAKHGFVETGRRRAYYERASGPPVDAVLMKVALPQRQSPETSTPAPKTG